MKILVNNVGKVVSANLDIDGISIIAGHNNTGKSSILKSVYLGINAFRNASIKVNEERGRSIRLIINRQEHYFDEQGYEFLPSSLLEDLSTMLLEKLSILVESGADYKEFKKIYIQSLEAYTDTIREINDDKIYKDSFIRPIFEKLEEALLRSKETYMKYFVEMYIKNLFGNQINNIINKNSARIDIDSPSGKNHIVINNNKVDSMSFNSINEPDAVYLPTYGILDIIDRSSLMKGRFSPENDLREYLSKEDTLVNTFEEYNEISENISIIKSIIDEVIHGKLVRTTSGSFFYKDNELEQAINMTNVASGMKIFLIIEKLVEKGILRKNSILLIDEPETNLHPEWHLKFAEILVLLYKYMGINSVINSHSPYFIRAIEVKMADHGIKENGRYYLMEKDKKGMYSTLNVTKETNKIYEKLYEPFEYL